MLFLASRPPNEPVFQRDISSALKIPPHFLGKILQSLVRSKLVVSQKGKAGGFALGKSPKEINLCTIINAIDGPVFLDGCILGFPGCCDESACPVHDQWKEIKRSIIEMLEGKSLEQLSRELENKLSTMDDYSDESE